MIFIFGFILQLQLLQAFDLTNSQLFTWFYKCIIRKDLFEGGTFPHYQDYFGNMAILIGGLSYHQYIFYINFIINILNNPLL